MSTRPLVVFAAGGTGGHLFPLLAVADALHARRSDLDIEFYCTERPIDARILEPAGCPRVNQPVIPLTRHPWRWPGFLCRWFAAQRLCKVRFRVRKPALVVGSGGFSSLPPALVARRLGIPVALLNPDAIPGRANRLLARRADAVYVQWESTRHRFSDATPVHVTGCPVRPAFLSAPARPSCERFGLDRARRTLLITGASLGARTLNEAMMRIAVSRPVWKDWQVLHLAGANDGPRLDAAYRRSGVQARVLDFCDQMADALNAADLVVARAGASTLAEVTAMGRAAILMPYPFHRDQHQRTNAAELAGRGAAIIVDDRVDPAQNAARLRAAIEELMQNCPRRERMARASREMGRPGAAAMVAEKLSRLAEL